MKRPLRINIEEYLTDVMASGSNALAGKHGSRVQLKNIPSLTRYSFLWFSPIIVFYPHIDVSHYNEMPQYLNI